MNSRTHAPLLWHRASFCPNGSACVEIASLPTGGAAMRDSKNPQSPELHFTANAWSEFITAARAGEFGRGSHH